MKNHLIECDALSFIEAIEGIPDPEMLDLLKWLDSTPAIIDHDEKLEIVGRILGLRVMRKMKKATK